MDVAGAQALVFATDRRRPSKSTIVRVTRRTTATVWHGTAIAAWLGPGHAYLTGDGGRLLAFSLASGRTTVVARLPVLTGAVVPSPDRKAFAAIATGPKVASPSRLVLVDRGRVRSVRIGGSAADVHWLDAARVVVSRYGGPDEVRLYNRSLRLLARFGGWHAQQTAVAAGHAYGLSWNGTLQWARLPNGPARPLVELPSPVAHTLLAVPR